MRQKLTGGLLVAAFAAAVALPGTALAGSAGRKNTALVLTGVAAHQLITGKTTNGVIAGVGAAYAWKRAEDARKTEKRRAQAAHSHRSHRYRRTARAHYPTHYRYQ